MIVMARPKARPRSEVAIRPTPYPQLAVEAAYTMERLENLRVSKHDRDTVARGLAAGVIGSVTAHSLGKADKLIRDTVTVNYDHDRRQPGRRMTMDFSGQRSVTEQVDRADAALLRNQINRFNGRGRVTEIELTYKPDVYQTPGRYEQVSRAVGTVPAAGQRQWKNGGHQPVSSITPGAFAGVITTSHRTYQRSRT
jgi:hypothetical protein